MKQTSRNRQLRLKATAGVPSCERVLRPLATNGNDLRDKKYEFDFPDVG
jgi:hypothetical protein